MYGKVTVTYEYTRFDGKMVDDDGGCFAVRCQFCLCISTKKSLSTVALVVQSKTNTGE